MNVSAMAKKENYRTPHLTKFTTGSQAVRQAVNWFAMANALPECSELSSTGSVLQRKSLDVSTDEQENEVAL